MRLPAIRRVLALGTALVASTALLAGCGGDGASGGPEGSPDQVTLTVFAAASLTAAFAEIGDRFEAANDGVTVRFNFAGSSDLVAQLQQGAPADVFAAADETTMARATDDGLVDGEPAVFAANVITLVTEPGNPLDIDGLDDLSDPDLTLVVCAPEVPCGAAAARVAESAGVDLMPASEEGAVTDVLTKVATGEADAGLVYVTDAAGAADRVARVDLAESADAVNHYPIAALGDSDHPEIARRFVEFVQARQGQDVLRSFGFRPPR